MLRLICLITLTLIPASVSAAVIHVPADRPTIQEGVDAALAGDTVLVAAGTYSPSTNGETYPIDIHYRSGITLKADGDVVIDCENSVYDNLIYILESDNIRVEGFTIRYAGRRGLYCRSSDEVYVVGNLFLDNDEGSLSSAWSTIYVLGNELANNAIRDANGLSGYETHTVAIGNVVHGFHTNQFWNVTGMGFSADDEPSYAYVANNIIYDNDCGVWGNDTEIVIVNNTIHDHLPPNPSDLKGRGIGFGPSNFGCLIANNIVTRSSNDGIHIYNVPNAELRCNDLYDNAYLFGTQYDGCAPGAGDIQLDPMYTDAGRADFHLQNVSPCINRADLADAPSDDFEGDARPIMGAADMGADEYAGTHLLAADAFSVSCATGGAVEFTLHAGAANDGRRYLILGSATGTVPGTPLPGGYATLPVNWDGFTDLVLAFLNTPVFSGFLGTLSMTGQASGQLNAPILDPGIAGTRLQFAYCLNHPFDFVSNPVPVKVTP